eukprot:4690477-Ditylum_brightwellii.AAC.1
MEKSTNVSEDSQNIHKKGHGEEKLRNTEGKEQYVTSGKYVISYITFLQEELHEEGDVEL